MSSTYENLEFNTSAVKRVALLQKENESLRQELAQMRVAMLQLKQTHQQPTTSTTESHHHSPGLDSRKAGKVLGGRARKERVKVAFSLMSVKHAMQRLRSSVQELQTGVDSDFLDARKMIDDKRKGVDDRIAFERPMVHRIHEAICELVRHGGNQKAETLQNLFSATSWGHTRMSLTQAAGDIVKELENLIAVAEQQRRAKEVLEVATIHKDRLLERANKAVIDMATTARNVVSTFATMARAVHSMANASSNNNNNGEEISHVKSVLVTRALTLPDLETLLASSSKKSNELSTKAIEKFARHLQDAAFAATSLLQSATQAVLEPPTTSTDVQNNINNNNTPNNNSNNSNNKKKRKSISFQLPGGATTENQHDGDEENTNNNNKNTNTINQPGLISVLRRRWVKSIFQRAMLRMKFRKCLTSIHDDFVLNNLVYELEHTKTRQEQQQQQDRESNNNKNDSATTTNKTKMTTTTKPNLVNPNSKWASASGRPTAPISSSHSNNNKTKQQTEIDAVEAAVLHNSKNIWTSEDERRLKIHEKNHTVRIKNLFGAAGNATSSMDNDAERKEARQTLHSKLISIAEELNLTDSLPAELRHGHNQNNNNNNKPSLSDNNNNNKVIFPSFLKGTHTSSRRALPSPAQYQQHQLNNNSASVLGKMSPLTGMVEVAMSSSRKAAGGSSGGCDTGLGSKSAKWFQPTTTDTSKLSSARVIANVPQPPPAPQQQQKSSKFSNVPIRSALKEFFVLNDDS